MIPDPPPGRRFARAPDADSSVLTAEQIDEHREPTRYCHCGCGQELPAGHSRQKYVNKTHGQRGYRKRVKARAEAAGVPATVSLATLPAPSPGGGSTSGGNGDPAKRRKPPRKKRRSDVRIPYDRIVAAMDEIGLGDVTASALRAHLTPEQLELLDTTPIPTTKDQA